MNLRSTAFISILLLIIGLVIGFSIGKSNNKPNQVVTNVKIIDTLVKVKTDTIKIYVDKVKYFKKDTVFIENKIAIRDSLSCVSVPLLLSDSSLISLTECSRQPIPTDLTFDAKYIDKRERIRIVERHTIDTVKQGNKRLGFTLGPSAGVGIDINNIQRPAYFLGVTLTYGFRF